MSVDQMVFDQRTWDQHFFENLIPGECDHLEVDVFGRLLRPRLPVGCDELRKTFSNLELATSFVYLTIICKARYHRSLKSLKFNLRTFVKFTNQVFYK